MAGNFEVGVHIADVSYFVEEGNSLDVIASQRATSVYLVQKVSTPRGFFPRVINSQLSGVHLNCNFFKFSALSVCLVTLQVIPMLPRLLCEELCSLNPLVDRLTFSVIWMLTPEGKVYKLI